MATITKADLESQVTELQQALAAAQQRVDDLTAQLEATAPERRDQLEQVVWLQRNAPGEQQRRYTREGGLILSFGAQYAALDKQSGQRLFGPMRWFTAFGDLAIEIDQVFKGDTRLARIGAYERPQLPAQDGTRRSEWVVAHFTAMPPLERPAAPEPAGYGEPTSEEVPF